MLPIEFCHTDNHSLISQLPLMVEYGDVLECFIEPEFTSSVKLNRFQAWSSIVYMLIPNVSEVERSLGEFADIMEADEVLLFERATFLVIAHAEKNTHRDVHRFEKISNIIKQFKLSCSKLAAQFQVTGDFT